MEPISLNVRLYGTQEPPAASRTLRAGPLSVELEAGNLRHIRHGAIEILRAISFIVRDRGWGTYAPRILGLSVREHAEHFDVSYEACVDDCVQRLSYSVSITGTPLGLRFSSRARAETDFETNRAGFVILHPIDGVAGRPATITHVDGRVARVRFPELIAPTQPMSQLRAIAHEPAAGLHAHCLMEGDTFEMEDQRNWTDASFKTYVRPLALPWPYTLPRNTELAQQITLSLRQPPSATPRTAAPTLRLDLGASAGALPAVGVGLCRAELATASAHIAELTPLRPRHLIYHFDPRASADPEADLRQAANIAHGLSAEPWLEAVVASVTGFEQELAELGRIHARIGSPFRVVLASPAADLRATLPGSPWPAAPPLPALYRAARQALPGVRLGGGMFSFFTELNRKRPPLDEIDLLTFTTSAIVHAADDATMIENLDSLPALCASVRSIAGGRPFVVGPSAIGMRMNPYGDTPPRNLANTRQPMNENDPRQRGLMGAAWALSYVCHMARGGAQAVTLGGVTGAQGVIAVQQPWTQPYFDQAGGYFPIFHVLRALAGLAECERLETSATLPATIDALIFRTQDAVLALVANLQPRPVTISLPADLTGQRVLDAAHFHIAAQDPAFLDTHAPASGRHLTLTAYAVASLRLRAPCG